MKLKENINDLLDTVFFVIYYFYFLYFPTFDPVHNTNTAIHEKQDNIIIKNISK